MLDLENVREKKKKIILKKTLAMTSSILLLAKLTKITKYPTLLDLHNLENTITTFEMLGENSYTS